MLNPSVLTIGFARRFSAYKRADLIFHDRIRLREILNNPWRPVQIIFAGKAHPADNEGKEILQRIYEFSQQPEFGGRIGFVEDYGEQMAQYPGPWCGYLDEQSRSPYGSLRNEWYESLTQRCA